MEKKSVNWHVVNPFTNINGEDLKNSSKLAHFSFGTFSRTPPSCLATYASQGSAKTVYVSGSACVNIILSLTICSLKFL